MDREEILVPINDECLPQLSGMYKNILDWAPYVHSFIETAMNWKNKGRNELTTFWSPANSWKKDGTFIALMQFGNYDLFMFTLDPNCTNLCRGILETKRINWHKPTVLFNLHSLHYPHVLRTFENMNLNVHFSLLHDMYFLDVQVALNQQIECPPEVYIKPLNNDTALVIDRLYKPHRHRYPDGDKFISTLIEMNQGYGLFLRENGELVSWVMRTCLGQIGFLQTVDGHHKKGYANVLAKVVSKQIADDGFTPMAAISQSNLPSLSLFRKLGFRQGAVCYFLQINKP